MNVLLLLALWLLPQEQVPLLDEEAEIRRCEEQLLQSPADQATTWQLGYLLYSRGELERARLIFSGSLQLQGDHGYTIYMLGAIAERQFLSEEALEQYRKCLTVAAGYEPALEGVTRTGRILSDLRRFREARSRISRELLLVLIGAGASIVLAAVLSIR